MKKKWELDENLNWKLVPHKEDEDDEDDEDGDYIKGKKRRSKKRSVLKSKPRQKIKRLRKRC